MIRSCVIAACVCAALLATGCVSTGKYNILEQQYLQSQDTVSEQKTEIATLKGKGETLTTKLDDTQGKLDTVESEKAGLEKKITELNGDIETLNKTTEKKITELNGNIEALNKTIEEVESENDNLVKSLGTITTKVEQADMKLKATTAQLNITKDKLTETEAVAKMLEENKVELERKLGRAASRFGECVKDAQVLERGLKDLMVKLSYPPNGGDGESAPPKEGDKPPAPPAEEKKDELAGTKKDAPPETE